MAERLDEDDVFEYLQLLEDERAQVLDADLIVLGEIVAQDTYQHERGPVLTAFTIRVEDVLKGAPAESVVVTSLMGGVLDGRVTSFPGGLDHPAAGERYVFMLSEDHTWRPGDYRGGGVSQRHRVVDDMVVEKGMSYREFARRIEEQLAPLEPSAQEAQSDQTVRAVVIDHVVYPMAPRPLGDFRVEPNHMLLRVTSECGGGDFSPGDTIQVELPPYFRDIPHFDEFVRDGSSSSLFARAPTRRGVCWTA